MDENKAREHHPPDAAEGSSEWAREQPEEPPQRWGDGEVSCLPRNEKIRLIVLGIALLVLLIGFLLYLLSRTVLPLFGVIVVVFLGYRRLDAWLDTAEELRH
ncbi:MAG: hypothetical protein M3Z08_01635 [Chloroflexota bacterium]|nr:hypothetical protein [Chloroflexota bacterium]